MNIADKISGFRADDCVYNEQGSLGPRVQGTLQLFYVYNGSAVVSVDGNERLVGPGEITLLLPDHVEVFQFALNEKTHHGYCSAFGAELSEKQRGDYQKLTAVFPLSGKIRELTDWAKTLQNRMEPSARNLYDGVCRTIFWEFFHIAGYPARQVPLPESVLRAKILMDEQFSTPLDLPQIARTACITSTHLIRLFKEHLATTPVSYLWSIREENGARLLAESGLSVSEIAYRCGFNEPYHFARRFKARYGMTPGAYRREQWRPR
jgi:AraC family transcriptional regulator of arabinose operon